jgi:hypothetical protein
MEDKLRQYLKEIGYDYVLTRQDVVDERDDDDSSELLRAAIHAGRARSKRLREMREAGEYLESIGAQDTLTEADAHDLISARDKVLELMLDGEWHTASEIETAAGDGQRLRSGLRRMRELRRWYNIETRIDGGREFAYRLAGKLGD